jgi:hypothetical protein
VEKRLTHMKVVRLEAPGLYADGGGLYLQVTLAQDGTGYSDTPSTVEPGIWASGL